MIETSRVASRIEAVAEHSDKQEADCNHAQIMSCSSLTYFFLDDTQDLEDVNGIRLR